MSEEPFSKSDDYAVFAAAFLKKVCLNGMLSLCSLTGEMGWLLLVSVL